MKRIVLIAFCVLIAAGVVFAGGRKAAGTLVCGVTDFEPMNYRDNRETGQALIPISRCLLVRN